jgi:hypothetical protein
MELQPASTVGAAGVNQPAILRNACDTAPGPNCFKAAEQGTRQQRTPGRPSGIIEGRRRCSHSSGKPARRGLNRHRLLARQKVPVTGRCLSSETTGSAGPNVVYYRRNCRRERLERIPPIMSKPAAAMPTRAAPSSSAIPTNARTPISSTKLAIPTGPSRVIWMRAVWCRPVDTQIRDTPGQSASGGMISGSMWGVLALGAGCCCIISSGFNRPGGHVGG